MPDNLMYFGTKDRMQWVKAPAPGAGFAATAYSAGLSYLNGGASQRNSVNAHMEYALSWSSITADEIAQIEDYAFGLYGDDLIRWLDPTAAERNVFNRAWAAPKITAEDGIPLIGTATPALVTVGDMSLGYPLQGAQYAITSGMAARKFYCPIPLGYTAWIGCHGLANARGLSVQPLIGRTASGAVVPVATTAVNNSTRFTASVSNTGTVNGIDISVDNTATYSLTLAGLMLQVLPTGVTPGLGGFISGRGNSGCQFDGKPTTQVYSVPYDAISMSAKLIEVGDWL